MNDRRQSTDPWIAGITRALRRASDRALRLSKATGTPFWVMKNGRMVNLNPKARGRRKGSSR
jgi:hypothetical protein